MEKITSCFTVLLVAYVWRVCIRIEGACVWCLGSWFRPTNVDISWRAEEKHPKPSRFDASSMTAYVDPRLWIPASITSRPKCTLRPPSTIGFGTLDYPHVLSTFLSARPAEFHSFEGRHSLTCGSCCCVRFVELKGLNLACLECRVQG